MKVILQIRFRSLGWWLCLLSQQFLIGVASGSGARKVSMLQKSVRYYRNWGGATLELFNARASRRRAQGRPTRPASALQSRQSWPE